MRAVRCAVGLNPQVVDLKTFEDLRRNVGTETSPAHVTRFSIGHAHMAGGALFDCWCDEDGEPKALPFNRHVNGMAVLGTYVFTRHETLVGDSDDDLPFQDMTPEQARTLSDMIRKR